MENADQNNEEDDYEIVTYSLDDVRKVYGDEWADFCRELIEARPSDEVWQCLEHALADAMGVDSSVTLLGPFLIGDFSKIGRASCRERV